MGKTCKLIKYSKRREEQKYGGAEGIYWLEMDEDAKCGVRE